MLDIIHSLSLHWLGRVLLIFSAGLIASLVALFAYGLDKRRAQLHAYRIPEGTLHALGIVGGWPGGLIAQRWFRHKTQKVSFQIQFYVTVAIHVALATAYIIFG